MIHDILGWDKTFDWPGPAPIPQPNILYFDSGHLVDDSG
jgi:hypothetical protein